jgi:hypothetical protein
MEKKLKLIQRGYYILKLLTLLLLMNVGYLTYYVNISKFLENNKKIPKGYY